MNNDFTQDKIPIVNTRKRLDLASNQRYVS